MRKETSFHRRFWEMHDEECEAEKTPLCRKMMCKCSVEIRREMISRACEPLFSSKLPGFFITICPENDVVSATRLSSFVLGQSRRRLYRCLRRLKIPDLMCIGHFDIMLQEETQSSKAKWHIHWHIIGFTRTPLLVLRAKAMTVFRNTNRRKNSSIRPIDRLPFNYGYIVKYDYELKKKVISKSNIQSQTQMKIKGIRRKELLAYLSSVNILDAFSLIGFRRYGLNITPIPK